MTSKSRFKLLIKDALLSTLFSSFIVFILSFSFINISFFDPLKTVLKDFSFLDIYYSENFNSNVDSNKNIALINIEHRDRFEINQLIEKVKKSSPKVIGLDIIFKELQDSIIDSDLSNNLIDDRIVCSYIIDNKNFIISNKLLVKPEVEKGYVNFNFEKESNVIRTFDGKREINNTKHNSFSVLVAEKYLNKSIELSNNLNDRRIKYYGKLNSFINFSFDEFMNLNDQSILKNKIVLLGYLGYPTGNKNDIEDKHFTPLNKRIEGKRIPDMYGVTIHANIINMLINNYKMFQISQFTIIVLSMLFLFLGNIFFLWLSKKSLITYLTVKSLVLFLFSALLMWLTFLLFKNGIVIESTIIIGIVVLGCNFIIYYKWIIKKIQNKIKWGSYI